MTLFTAIHATKVLALAGLVIATTCIPLEARDWGGARGFQTRTNHIRMHSDRSGYRSGWDRNHMPRRDWMANNGLPEVNTRTRHVRLPDIAPTPATMPGAGNIAADGFVTGQAMTSGPPGAAATTVAHASPMACRKSRHARGMFSSRNTVPIAVPMPNTGEPAAGGFATGRGARSGHPVASAATTARATMAAMSIRTSSRALAPMSAAFPPMSTSATASISTRKAITAMPRAASTRRHRRRTAARSSMSRRKR